MKHLLKLQDWSAKEITETLNLADQLKFEKKNGIEHHYLKGKTLGMIFQKSSTRTRVSFEVGMYDLGGSALFLSSRELQIGRGEPVEDTARVLSRYLDGIMIRTFAQEEVETLAKVGSIPIVNGLVQRKIELYPRQMTAIRDVSATLANGSPRAKARPGDTFPDLPANPASEPEKPITAKDIAALRKEMKLTQVKFGELFGVSARKVSEWEHGKSLPDASLQNKIRDLQKARHEISLSKVNL